MNKFVYLLVCIFAILENRASCAEKRLALLIGNQNYSRIDSLKNPHNDIKIIEKALTEAHFKIIPPVKDASRTVLFDTVKDFSKQLGALGPDAIGFIYYAGHGKAVIDGGPNYLIPSDIADDSRDEVERDGLDLNKIISWLSSNAPQAAHFIVIDACRDIAKGKPSKRGGDGGRGFTELENQPGMFIAYSTRPGRLANDGKGNNSPFARALAKQLIAPIEYYAVFPNIRDDMATDDDARGQNPWWADGLEKGIRFVGASVAAVRAEDDKGKAEDSEDPEDLRRILRQLGPAEGNLKDVVESRLKTLRQRQFSSDRESIRTRGIQCDGVSLASRYGDIRCIAPGSGTFFKDCERCPEMVLIPAGSFDMGSPPEQREALTKRYGSYFNDEKLRTNIKIDKVFAVGRFEVTFREWDACVAEGDCKYSPITEWERDRQPVINISWDDVVREYLPWLKKKTNKQYRLLTNIEWEYVARANTKTNFWWGDNITSESANYDGNYTFNGGDIGIYRQRTLSVDSFNANPWGLYQVHGNVWEWTEDCADIVYKKFANDFSSRPPKCKRRITRGGSWTSKPWYLRSANISWQNANHRGRIVGFRVAREIVE
jgi:formylglycine-generating enzyme required for sulfatase activity